MGVFYVESPAMRQLQQKTGRGDFDHLVIHSSIIRPAANRFIHQYIRRPARGALRAAPSPPQRTPGGNLRDSGLPGRRGAGGHGLAGFTWAEADGLRKVISKKSPEQLADYHQRFIDGCRRRSIAGEVVKAVWEMFLSFSGYSFCKPHSASYALVSFKSAYLKAHYPAEFMAAVISNGGGYYSTLAYISEARRMGITVLGPDLNASDWPYRGAGKTIRVGLQQLQNIRKDILQAILEERDRNGPFKSLEDFLQRVELTPADGAVLVKSGALDSLAGIPNPKPQDLADESQQLLVNSQEPPARLNRPQLLWFVEAWLNRNAASRDNGKQAGMMFGSRSRPALAVPPLPDLARARQWQQETETLGFVLSVHPLTMWKPVMRALPCLPLAASQLAQYVGNRVWVAGWPITRKEVITKSREPMEFFSFEDQTAIYETVFFPRAFQRFCQELNMDRAYLLGGAVESEFGTVSLNVERVRKLNPLEAVPK